MLERRQARKILMLYANRVVPKEHDRLKLDTNAAYNTIVLMGEKRLAEHIAYAVLSEEYDLIEKITSIRINYEQEPKGPLDVVLSAMRFYI